MATKEPKTPEEALATIGMAAKNVSVNDAGEGGNFNNALKLPEFTFERPTGSITINGFETKIAADMYTLTGNRDVATRAEALIKLLGQELYSKCRISAKCAGIDNEADYLAQQLWLALESDTFDITGAEQGDETGPDPGFNRETDGQVSSPINNLISQYLRPSNLGRIVQLAKAYEREDGVKGVSVQNALRYGVLNFMVIKLQRGH